MHRASDIGAAEQALAQERPSISRYDGRSCRTDVRYAHAPLQLTAFGARDRGFFEVILWSAPRRQLKRRPLDGNPILSPQCGESFGLFNHVERLQGISQAAYG
jgi:hypothetical protein